MTHHLEVSTITAMVCALAAMAVPRSSAALRHLILLLGLLRFAAYTPWLTGLGGSLDRFVPEHRPPTPRLVHATLHLLADPAPVPAVLTPPLQTLIGLKAAELKTAAWWLWYAVAAFGVGAWLGSLARGVRAVRDATFWERDLFLQVAAKMGMDVKADLRIIAPHAIPGAQGWLRPRVLLPDGLMSELTEAELEPVLAHELAHLRRRDPLMAGLVRGIVSIFWFHPLLWWMERRMLAERETACDEMALASGSSARDYVAGIAKICRATTAGNPAYPSVAGANLASRIEHVLTLKPGALKSRGAWPRAVAAIPILFAVFAALGPVASGLLHAQEARVARGVDLAAELQSALALDASGRQDEAILRYLRILEFDPYNVVALNNAAYNLADRGHDLDQALAYGTRAHRLKPGSPDVDDTLGWVYLKREAPDRALPFFRDSVLAQPNNFEFRSHLAQALDKVPDPPTWMRELRGWVFTSGPAADAHVRELLERIGR